jgi:hypothetical protein
VQTKFGGGPGYIDFGPVTADGHTITINGVVRFRDGITATMLSWELRPADAPDRGATFAGTHIPIQSSNPAFTITQALAVPNGAYDLWVYLLPPNDIPNDDIQTIRYLDAYHESNAFNYTRPLPTKAPYAWTGLETVTTLKAGTTNTLSVNAGKSATAGEECHATWSLLLADRSVAAGTTESCTNPALEVPALDAGTYTLQLAAFSVTSGGTVSTRDDLVDITVTLQ